MPITPSNPNTLVGPLFLATVLVLTGCGGGSEEPKSPNKDSGTNSTPASGTSSVAAGKALFEPNCAVCHGPTGKGDGVGAAGLAVKPRDLSVEPYKFVPIADSDSEVEALIAYLKVGRIESGMPPYGHLKPEELRSLALFVESLRPKPNFVDPIPTEGDGEG